MILLSRSGELADFHYFAALRLVSLGWLNSRGSAKGPPLAKLHRTFGASEHADPARKHGLKMAPMRASPAYKPANVITPALMLTHCIDRKARKPVLAFVVAVRDRRKRVIQMLISDRD